MGLFKASDPETTAAMRLEEFAVRGEMRFIYTDSRLWLRVCSVDGHASCLLSLFCVLSVKTKPDRQSGLRYPSGYSKGR